MGSRNYLVFLVCVVSAVTSSGTVSGLAALELVGSLTMENPGSTYLDTSSLVLITVVGVVSAIAALLLVHLCLFHGYIACLGLTTYEYVRSKRDREAKVQEQGSECGAKICKKKEGEEEEEEVRYHCCEGVQGGKEMDSRNLYFCSTFQEESVGSARQERERNKFHLYFSYEARNNETTSIQLTSRLGLFGG